MQLILMRHGQAEHSFGKRDIERSLTMQGKKDIRLKAAKLVRKLLNISPSEIQLLSSPARRTKETATLLLEELKELPFHVNCRLKEDIYVGNESKILEAIADSEPNTLLILIGHQPTLSYLAAHICGQGIPFHTSDIACFEIIDKLRIQGDLLWQIN